MATFEEQKYQERRAFDCFWNGLLLLLLFMGITTEKEPKPDPREVTALTALPAGTDVIEILLSHRRDGHSPVRLACLYSYLRPVRPASPRMPNRCMGRQGRLKWMAGLRGGAALEHLPGPWEPCWAGVGCAICSTRPASLRMPYVVESQLDTLSVKELRELKDNIETAVRAAIRQRNQVKLISGTPAIAAPVKPMDLEAEAKTWLAARRK